MYSLLLHPLLTGCSSNQLSKCKMFFGLEQLPQTLLPRPDFEAVKLFSKTVVTRCISVQEYNS